MKFGIISDIHEDVVRLKEALAGIEKKKCDEIICLGDIIGFTYPNFGYFDTRNASECIRLVKENCRYIVAGNHDFYPVKRIPEHNAGFNYPKNWYDLDYPEKKKLAGEEVWVMEEVEFDPLISADEKEFMSSIPEWLVIESEKLFISHYLYPDLPGMHAQYYHNFGPVKPHLDFIRSKDCSIGFSGHQHIEGARIFTENRDNTEDFGITNISDELQWVVGPCIANGKKHNGYMIFNSESRQLEIVPLNTPPRMMQTVYV